MALAYGTFFFGTVSELSQGCRRTKRQLAKRVRQLAWRQAYG